MTPFPPRPGDCSEGADLIRALRSDDPEALRLLMTELWAPLVGYAQRILPAAGDPEDIIQDVFARLWVRRHALREEGSLKALLYTMVRNACLDERRKGARREEAAREGPTPAPPRTPYEDVQGAELQRAAAAAVASLPARRREVFRLVREEGLSYQEVAHVMDLSPQTVANHMSLAMADLRTALRPFLPSQRENPAVGSESLQGEKPETR